MSSKMRRVSNTQKRNWSHFTSFKFTYLQYTHTYIYIYIYTGKTYACGARMLYWMAEKKQNGGDGANDCIQCDVSKLIHLLQLYLWLFSRFIYCEFFDFRLRIVPHTAYIISKYVNTEREWTQCAWVHVDDTWHTHIIWLNCSYILTTIIIIIIRLVGFCSRVNVCA